MTQHGNAAKGYGLRARAPQRLRNLEAAISRDELADPAAEAAVAAGLRPRGLTKAELLHFRGRNKEYIEARNRVLVQWASNPVRVLDAEACAGVSLHCPRAPDPPAIMNLALYPRALLRS